MKKPLLYLAVVFAAAVAVVIFFKTVPAAESARNRENAMDENKSGKTEIAVFGGGCFWCIEAVYERIDGVKSVVSGYAGGLRPSPTYREVCSDTTGHAEVVRIEYDPDRIGYEDLLELFWKAHDPTTPNQQGADVGSQYRSIILYSDEKQKKVAEKSKEKIAAHFDAPVVTEIKPLEVFYPAEDYHQDYYEKHPTLGYCSVVIRPKLKKLGLE